MFRATVFSIGLTLVCLPALAGEWAVGDDQIEACRTTGDRVRRLTCFDALFRVPKAPDVVAETTPPPRPASPLRSLALSQERGRGAQVTPVTRVRPWGPEGGAVSVEPVEASDPSVRDLLPVGADVFVTVAETPGPPDPPPPLDERAVLLLTCEHDITGLYFVLPEPVSDGRARVEIAGDRGAPMTLNWRDFGHGDVILAGRGLESIALIRSLSASRRLHVRVDYPKGPRAFVFEVSGLDEALKPLRQACHW
jgi:type VI secretion system protein VasI